MTNKNDPLVAAVARAICFANWDGPISAEAAKNITEYRYDIWLEEARAAIKAVLEWYSKMENVSDEMARGWHTANYCDGWSFDEMCTKVTGYADDVKHPFAAAMAAELKRREG